MACRSRRPGSLRSDCTTSSRATAAARSAATPRRTLLLLFLGASAGLVALPRRFVGLVIADDALERAYIENRATLAADGQSNRTEDHGVLPLAESLTVRRSRCARSGSMPATTARTLGRRGTATQPGARSIRAQRARRPSQGTRCAISFRQRWRCASCRRDRPSHGTCLRC